MQLRTLLLGGLQELGSNAGHDMLSIDLFKAKMMERNIGAEDFAYEMQAALHDGDIAINQSNMISITEKGVAHYTKNLELV